MLAILFSHFEKITIQWGFHIFFLFGTCRQGVRSQPTIRFLFVTSFFFQSYFYFLLKTKKIYNIISLIYISISKNALKCPCNQGLLYKKYYGITFFVRNLPTRCSLPADYIFFVRHQPTMGFGVVTLVYVDKRPKQ